MDRFALEKVTARAAGGDQGRGIQRRDCGLSQVAPLQGRTRIFTRSMRGIRFDATLERNRERRADHARAVCSLAATAEAQLCDGASGRAW